MQNIIFLPLFSSGKPPPDEVDILRNQILLLHNQLLFERHRKDVHSERIRRILGRAKKLKMQEELSIALVRFFNLCLDNVCGIFKHPIHLVLKKKAICVI